MDNRCPVCAGSLARRKLSHAVVARMELDCTHCKSRIRLNVHPAELMIVVLSFAAFVVLATLAYGSQHQGLLLSAFGAAMVGAAALPVLEQTYLRAWPRYAPIDQSHNP